MDDSTKQAVVFPYISVIDQLSGDPTYQSPALLATANVLFPKTAIDPTAIGRRIDINFARQVRATAAHLGEGRLETR